MFAPCSTDRGVDPPGEVVRDPGECVPVLLQGGLVEEAAVLLLVVLALEPDRGRQVGHQPAIILFLGVEPKPGALGRPLRQGGRVAALLHEVGGPEEAEGGAGALDECQPDLQEVADQQHTGPAVQHLTRVLKYYFIFRYDFIR